MNKKIIITFAAITFVCTGAFAQSKGFVIGKWIELHSEILKELNRSYVDSLPVDRIEKAGVSAMLSNLDPYTIYIPEEDNENLEMMLKKTYGGIGAVIYKPSDSTNVIINEPYEGSPAARAGLRCGDEIMEVDGVSVIGHDSKESSDMMKGNPGTTVVFKVKKLRGGIENVKIVRERIHIPDIEYVGMLDSKTGYIVQSGFTQGVSAELKKNILKLKKENGMEKLILDLRGNGGGLLAEAIDIVSLFVPKGSIVVTSKGANASDSFRTTRDPIDLNLPLVILVDGGSASASEIVSGALQDMDRATIMGTRTFGKGLVQSIRTLPYGGTLKVTTAKYYTPSGRCVQAIDYSSRNEDGSVGYIPDSLTHEFSTAHGRKVRDGGGITPDVIIEPKPYSRLTYSLVLNGVIDNYAMKYACEHESIPSVQDFHLSDEEYEDFIEYAKGKTFDYRSSAKTLFDQMKKELEKDMLDAEMESELQALGKALDMDKEQFLRLKQEEIVPFIEEEIVIRYYFQRAAVSLRIRYDDQLKTAMSSPLIQKY